MTDAPAILRPSGAGALIIDGKIAAAGMIAAIKHDAAALIGQGTTPGLATVLVGDDPASAVYVRSKGRLARECGFHSVQHDLAGDVSEEALLRLVDTLNADPAIHGILVQMPLPKHIDSSRVLRRVDPAKDVDGFHPVNAGLLAIGDASVLVVVASPHRVDAFAACRYAIERVKQIAPVWKRETFDGGEAWLEGASADPDDGQARAEALKIACA